MVSFLVIFSHKEKNLVQFIFVLFSHIMQWQNRMSFHIYHHTEHVTDISFLPVLVSDSVNSF